MRASNSWTNSPKARESSASGTSESATGRMPRAYFQRKPSGSRAIIVNEVAEWSRVTARLTAGCPSRTIPSWAVASSKFQFRQQFEAALMRSDFPASAARASSRSVSLKACSGTRLRVHIRTGSVVGHNALADWRAPSVERRLRERTISSAGRETSSSKHKRSLSAVEMGIRRRRGRT